MWDGELDSSIAKDLIDSKDPKYTQFGSRSTGFLGMIFPATDSNLNRFIAAAESWKHICYQSYS